MPSITVFEDVFVAGPLHQLTLGLLEHIKALIKKRNLPQAKNDKTRL